MVKKFFVAVVLILAFVGAKVAPAAYAGHVNTTCDFSQSNYKFAGRYHWDTGNPSWSTSGGLIMSMRYWSFTGAGDASAGVFQYGNYDGSTFFEVGLAAGYDPWGNKLSQNYPIGIFTNLYHPNDGHSGPATYIPNSWGLVRFAEVTTPTSYTFNSISDNFPLSAGQSIWVRNDGNQQFSMIDQDNHTLGIANHVTVPFAAGNQIRILSIQLEDRSFDGWCDAGILQTSNFQDPNGTYWAGYNGCSANGWQAQSPSDPTCRGGAASQNAPLDVWQNYNCGTCFQHQMYEQEAETATPPFGPVRDPATLPVASDNLGGRVNGTAPTTLHSMGTRWEKGGVAQAKEGPSAMKPSFVK